MIFRQNGLKIILMFVLIWGFTGLKTVAFSSKTVDHSLYGELLNKYVKNDRVDYQGFKNEESKLDRYLKVLENAKPQNLPRDEQFAFYVNAYNAWTIKLILGAYPGIQSIKDLGNVFRSPWKKKIARIDGGMLTLDHIEHDILRARFKDPRVHFAVNCASKGCPPLRNEPYKGNVLDQQLNDMAKAFINDRTRNYLKGNTLYVSKIFRWFDEDFNDDVVGFFLKYAEGDLQKQLIANQKNIKVAYLEFDWSLNEN